MCIWVLYWRSKCRELVKLVMQVASAKYHPLLTTFFYREGLLTDTWVPSWFPYFDSLRIYAIISQVFFPLSAWQFVYATQQELFSPRKVFSAPTDILLKLFMIQNKFPWPFLIITRTAFMRALDSCIGYIQCISLEKLCSLEGREVVDECI